MEDKYLQLWESLPVASIVGVFPEKRWLWHTESMGISDEYDSFREIVAGTYFFTSVGEYNQIYKLLREEPFENMPLFINHPGLGIYAKWRLKNGA